MDQNNPSGGFDASSVIERSCCQSHDGLWYSYTVYVIT